MEDDSGLNEVRAGGAEDVELVRRALDGDAAARRDLEDRLARLPDLVRACHARMRRPLRPEDVDDVVQDVSLAVCRRLGDFRGSAQLETWIYGIARLAILTRLQGLRRERLRWSRRSPLSEDLHDDPDAAVRPDDSGMRRQVADGLRAAGGTVERIVRHRHLDGESFGEIGRRLRLPEATVKSRYYRGLPRIKRALSRVWSEVSG